jgi:hypothetical protein
VSIISTGLRIVNSPISPSLMDSGEVVVEEVPVMEDRALFLEAHIGAF